jgi:hypothetical protein
MPLRDIKRVQELLIKCALWEDVNEEFYCIHDYLEYNPSSEVVKARRRADSTRKSSGFQRDSSETPPGIQPSRPRTPSPTPSSTPKVVEDNKPRIEIPDWFTDALARIPGFKNIPSRNEKLFSDIQENSIPQKVVLLALSSLASKQEARNAYRDIYRTGWSFIKNEFTNFGRNGGGNGESEADTTETWDEQAARIEERRNRMRRERPHLFAPKVPNLQGQPLGE